ncbi:MAG: glycosyltransferase family 1 protein [Chryseolinea sp.]
MRIGFDAKRLFNNFTGLGNYSRFVVKSLQDHTHGNEYFLYTPKRKHYPGVEAISSNAHTQTITPSALYKITGTSSLWRSWGISLEASIKSIEVFHGLSQELPLGLPRRVKKIVTVHDLIFLRYPELYKRIDAKIYESKVAKACEIADQIIAISQQTADDLKTFLNVSPSRIKVIYQGCHQQFRQKVSTLDLEQVRSKHKMPSEYLLNVGTLEKRKNVMLAVRALGLLKDQLRLSLVIVGRETAYKQDVVQEATRVGVLDQLIFLHNVAFHDLPAIYQGASIFLYPSFFEGFGIPIVEAIESGVPVISSKGSCFEEAGGPDSIYIDPAQPVDLAEQILKVMLDIPKRQSMISCGKEYVKRFEPNRIADELMKVYAGVS